MPILKVKLEVEEIGRGMVWSTEQTLSETETGWQEYNLVTATTDQAIPFTLSTGITTIDVLLITSDITISYKANGNAVATTLDANCVHLLWGTSITAFLVTNASGSTAHVKILIGG